MTYSALSKWVIFIVHILFWVGLWFGSFSFASQLGLTRGDVLVWSLSDIATQALLTYLNAFIYLPRYFKERKYTLYTFIILVTMAVLTFIRMQFLHGVFDHPVGPPFLFTAGFPLVGFFFISSAGWFIVDWFQSRGREVELVNNQLDAELKFLKLQLNPHFLFNTLNNIYSLAYFNDKQTPQAIMKLSDMMRHMIYDSQDKFISLSKEVDFIENFIELQKIKVDHAPDIRFTKSGVSENHSIAPLLFLAFLENSFKHGSQSPIDIDLKVEKNVLHFQMSNQVSKNPVTQTEKSGVGLMNVRKRLELIYPNKHELIMHVSEGKFIVQLNVTLS